MSASKFTEFNLPPNAYAAFDATSMKQLMVNRLKNSGLFGDIDFEGSNISGITDVLAFSYHTLLFYLNQVASDSSFSQAELFENMNKIVSLIGYKPTGDITSSLSVGVSASSDLDVGSYTIKRFSNITSQGITYIFNKDVTFQKTLSGIESITSIGNSNLMYQGTVREYPEYTALGETFEQFTLNINYPNDVAPKTVDFNNIFVFVKDINKNKWFEWTETNSLYLADSVSKVFEKRLNEFGHYELKFGNGVNGKKLSTGDIVTVYYLESDGSRGVLGVNTIGKGRLVEFKTDRFTEIFNDIGNRSDYLDANGLLTLSFDNGYSSTPPTFTETVDDIRQNAPSIFSAQNRTVTKTDYESFIKKNFSGVVQSVKSASNKEYTSEFLSYFYDIGLERPNLDNKVLFNQVTFADSCDFNNVYLFCVPKIGAIQGETTPISLFPAQKQSIVDKIDSYKMIGHNVVVCDPVYMAFDIGLPENGETLNETIKDETVLRIYRQTSQIISKEQIKSNIATVFNEFFKQANNSLGQFLDFNTLSFDILSINGVKSIETVRTSNGVETKISKLNFVYWNPLYPTSNIQSTSQNLKLSYFQFPFLYKASSLINKIEII